MLKYLNNTPALYERQLNVKVKAIRDAKSGEYISTEMYVFLERNGIKVEKTHTDASHENGLAERYNRTLADASRTMLAQSRLNASLVGEEFKSASYVKKSHYTFDYQEYSIDRAYRKISGSGDVQTVGK